MLPEVFFPYSELFFAPFSWQIARTGDGIIKPRDPQAFYAAKLSLVYLCEKMACLVLGYPLRLDRSENFDGLCANV
jgi:hypothetical protein